MAEVPPSLLPSFPSILWNNVEADGRSGRYLYKPDLKNTCCKLYAVRTIRKGGNVLDQVGGEKVYATQGT